MESSDRQGVILAELRARDRVTVPEIARLVGCSEMTVRRDLDALARDGLVRRVRGAAVSALTGEETPFPVRSRAGVEPKRRIGRAAANLLRDGETVVIDGGTTALEVAQACRDRRLTVVPLSMHTANALTGAAGIRLVLPGGDLRPTELAFVGPLTEHAMDLLRFDAVVLGCCGITARDGLTGHDLAESTVKRAAIRAAKRVIVVADASKWGATAFSRICAPDQIDVIVTDPEAPAEQVAAFRTSGTEIVSA
ncbi:DeoR/GlpR family DNA-binding transcription regulator [Actinopolymorpha sp. B11F2]|uniref:DeoR/GlpR family DNA-binding transcription regulator n=1 Tax=Actinopolymorpha sp. B11F2 TaxID=3160862 RepID=UPI0032E39963